MRLIDGDKLYEALREAGMVFALRMVAAAPTIATLPNGPLTLEELREMDGEPVWDKSLRAWGLVVGDFILYRNGEKLPIFGNMYRRRKPEGNT